MGETERKENKRGETGKRFQTLGEKARDERVYEKREGGRRSSRLHLLEVRL